MTSEIHDDITKVANRVCQPSLSGAVYVNDVQHILDVARAILAEREAATMRERERCAKIAAHYFVTKNHMDAILKGEA